MKELEAPPRAEKENYLEGRSVTLQDYSQPVEKKRNEPPLEKVRAGFCQSELSAQVNSKAMVNQILKTPISLSLGDVLVTSSREITTSLQDLMKLKNPVQKSPASHTVHEVFNSSGHQEEAVDIEEIYAPDYNDEDSPEDKPSSIYTVIRSLGTSEILSVVYYFKPEAIIKVARFL